MRIKPFELTSEYKNALLEMILEDFELDDLKLIMRRKIDKLLDKISEDAKDASITGKTVKLRLRPGNGDELVCCKNIQRIAHLYNTIHEWGETNETAADL